MAPTGPARHFRAHRWEGYRRCSAGCCALPCRTYIVMGYTVMACIVVAYTVMTYTVMAYIAGYCASLCRTYHIDMRMDVRIDMRVDIRTDMRTDIRTDMRIYRRNDISLDAVAAHNFEGSRRGLGERRWLVFFRFFFKRDPPGAASCAGQRVGHRRCPQYFFFCWRRRAGMAAGVGAGCCAPPWSFPSQHIRQPPRTRNTATRVRTGYL